MIKKLIPFFKWGVILALGWLTYLFLTILNFPNGKLTNSADVAVVLGAAVYQSEPSPVFAERLNHAINLYHAGKVAKLIFTGGTADQNIPAESVVARDYAIKKKVSANDIYIEIRSATTKENLIYAKQIIDRENFDSVLIVSDALHLQRTLMMARDLAINAKPSATPTSRYKSLKTRLPFAFRELYFYHHYLIMNE